MLGEQLQRDVALESLVEGEVHRRHAADSETAFDAVAACDRRGACHCPLPPPLPGPAPPVPPTVPVPPKPAPPLPVVVEVPVPVVEVAVVLVGVLVVLVLVVDVGVVEVDVLVEVVVEVEVLLVVGVVVLRLVQSLAASWLTVKAPCWRLLTSADFTDPGRLVTAWLNADAAFAAAAHWPVSTAWET